MILDVLRLGFLLDFVSTPILTGFVSAAAITIGLWSSRLTSRRRKCWRWYVLSPLSPSLRHALISHMRSNTATQIHDILAQLPGANGHACAIGFSSVVALVVLGQFGKRWGSRSHIAFYFSITRAFICVLLFTGISYAVNGVRGSNPKSFLFDVAEVKSATISPEVTDSKLLTKAISKAAAPFVAASLEHIAIARTFGLRNNYEVDASQELFSWRQQLAQQLLPRSGLHPLRDDTSSRRSLMISNTNRLPAVLCLVLLSTPTAGFNRLYLA